MKIERHDQAKILSPNEISRLFTTGLKTVLFTTQTVHVLVATVFLTSTTDYSANPKALAEVLQVHPVAKDAQ